MDKKEKRSALAMLRRFTPFARPHAAWAALATAFALAGMAASIAQAGFVQRLIDAALGLQGGLVARIALYYAGAMAAELVVAFMVKYSYGVFSARYMHDLRLHAVDRLQRVPMAAMEERHSGDLLSRLSNDLTTVQDFMGGTFLDAFQQFSMLILAASYMAWLNWKLLLVSIIPVPVALITVNAMTRNMYGYFRKAGEALGKANSVLQDSLGGVLTVKAYNLQAAVAKRFGVHIDECVGFDTKAAGVMRWTPPFNILLRALPTVFCIGFGSYLIIGGELTPGELISFHFLFGFVQWPLAFLPDMIVRIKHAMGSGDRVAEVLDIPPERTDGADFSGDRSAEAIRFENVGFSYGDGPKVLDGLGFGLREGERIAIVGASGSGKTTILKLLSGDYESHEGVIRVNGRDTREWNLSALRERFSVISQDVFLFPASIRENIGFGRAGASAEDVEAAARIANADEFVERMPDGYESQVGERGIKLSGGQKQRLAIARAILKDAPVLLLDEPTSALDTHSEALVQEAIDRSLERKTAIIIAHRLSTIKGADRIIVLDKGAVAEEGSHEELIARNGLYASLYERQFNSAEAVDAEETAPVGADPGPVGADTGPVMAGGAEGASHD